MIAEQAREANQNGPFERLLVPCEEPRRNGSGDDHVLAADNELRTPEHRHDIVPPRRLNRVILHVLGALVVLNGQRASALDPYGEVQPKENDRR